MKKEKRGKYHLSIPEGYVIPVLKKDTECPLAESDVIKVEKNSIVRNICMDIRSGAYAKHNKLTLDLGTSRFVVSHR